MTLVLETLLSGKEHLLLFQRNSHQHDALQPSLTPVLEALTPSSELSKHQACKCCL